jgi:hypothetical protein
MEFKPRPYTKREFLSKLQEPYKNPETEEEVLPVASSFYYRSQTWPA